MASIEVIGLTAWGVGFVAYGTYKFITRKNHISYGKDVTHRLQKIHRKKGTVNTKLFK